MSWCVAELAGWVAGDVRGDAHRTVTGCAPLARATAEELSFASNDLNLRRLSASNAGVVLVSHTRLTTLSTETLTCVLIGVNDPQLAMVEIMQRMRPETPALNVGLSAQATISDTAVFGADCQIFPGAFIGERVRIGARCVIHPGVVISDDCTLGDDCLIYPNAVLYPQVTVGNRVILHANSVLGADGFGYRFTAGRFEKVPQLGSVQIHDDVEIGACATIDRGAIGPTVIGEGTKLDNHVMIGHNCELGKHNAFASQVGLAGSVTTGDYVRCAGQVGIADHVHLGTGSVYGAKTGIMKDMEGGQTYLGIPATPEMEQIKLQLSLRKLPQLLKQMRDLEQQVTELQRQLQKSDATHRAA